MKRLLKDWRNYTLIAAGIVILVLISSLFAVKSGSRALVYVNQAPVTEGQLLGQMKNRYGDDTLMELVSTRLIEAYALQQKVTVSSDEIDQLIEFQRYFMLAKQGRDLDTEMQAQGMTIEIMRDQARTQALQVKLIVPEDDRRVFFQKAGATLSYAPRYKLREFYFASTADAQKAIKLLAKADAGGEALTEVAQLAQFGADSMKVQTYVPQPEMQDSVRDKALSQMKGGQVSQPLPVPPLLAQRGAKGWKRIIQLLSVMPGEKATFDNRSIITGMMLMQQEQQKYALAARELEAKALEAVDVQFASDEYKRAYDRFQKSRIENPNIPQANPDALPELPTVPSGGQ